MILNEDPGSKKTREKNRSKIEMDPDRQTDRPKTTDDHWVGVGMGSTQGWTWIQVPREDSYQDYIDTREEENGKMKSDTPWAVGRRGHQGHR